MENSPIETLRQLKEMLDAGTITPTEFEALKQKLVFNAAPGASAAGPAAPAGNAPASPPPFHSLASLEPGPVTTPLPSQTPPLAPLTPPAPAVPPISAGGPYVPPSNSPSPSTGASSLSTGTPPSGPGSLSSASWEPVVPPMGPPPVASYPEPAPIRPVPIEPAPVRPAPTEEPVPVRPVPIEPAPVRPVPAEPVPVADEYEEELGPRPARNPLNIVLTIGGLLALLALVLYLSLNRRPSERLTSTSQTAEDAVVAPVETGPQAAQPLRTETAPETVRVVPARPARPVAPRPAPAARADSTQTSTVAPVADSSDQ